METEDKKAASEKNDLHIVEGELLEVSTGEAMAAEVEEETIIPGRNRSLKYKRTPNVPSPSAYGWIPDVFGSMSMRAL